MTPVGRPIQIKICGITNLDDAWCAAEAGAGFLGFIFYPRSPRYVTPLQAAAITQAIQVEFGASAPRTVGVFVDETADRVQTVLQTAHLDLAQLHGSETPDVVRQLHPRAFKAIRPRTHDKAAAALAAFDDVFLDIEALPQLLLDAYHPVQPGGTGLQADLTAARALAQRCRLLLAGGLTPETVGDAIKAVRPWGVDVSSGVEKEKGLKDHARVRAFILAARGTA
jgi:phosphoribosylanthranilate isomerase